MLNGTLCVLYGNNGEWNVSSTISVDGSEKVDPALCEAVGAKSQDGTCCCSSRSHACSFATHEGSSALRDVFWNLWTKVGYKLPSDEDQCKRCYLFQLAAEGLGAFSGIGPSLDDDSTPPRNARVAALTSELRLPKLVYIATACLSTMSHQTTDEVIPPLWQRMPPQRCSFCGVQHPEWERLPRLQDVGDRHEALALMEQLPPTIFTGLMIQDGR